MCFEARADQHRKHETIVGRNASSVLKSRLQLGLNVHNYMNELGTDNQTTKWKSFVTTQLKKTYTLSEKKRCKRALNEWKIRTHDGAYSIQTIVGINPPMRMSSEI